jgi:hypothetical protein
MNKIYESYFHEDEPARSTIIAALGLPNICIEIDCIAYSGSPLYRYLALPRCLGDLERDLMRGVIYA